MAKEKTGAYTQRDSQELHEATRPMSTDEFDVTGDPAALNVRRVYALPQEMVDRIVEFQREKGYSSEVEAARRLLDEGLMSRDNLEKIINRFLGNIAVHKSSAVAARNVLVGHPLVKSISFYDDDVEFMLKSDEGAYISENGHVSLRPQGGSASWKRGETRFAPGKIDFGDVIPF